MDERRARGDDARVPARRRGLPRGDDDHRVRPRHPAGEHADRRARRPARPRPGLPDPRPGRALARARLRLPALSRPRRRSPREAAARLATLSDYTELGSGFAIAMRDLELRGAGDLLGDEQSGHVAAVGFELYVSMLDEAVEELRAARRRGRGRGAGAARRRRRRLPARRVHPLRGGEDRRPPPRRRRPRAGRAARPARRAPRPLRPAARAGREPARAPARADRARPPRRAHGRVPRRAAVGDPARARLRGASGRLRERIPEAIYDRGRRPLSLRVPDEPEARLAAVLALADALAAALAEPAAA